MYWNVLNFADILEFMDSSDLHRKAKSADYKPLSDLS